jgi:pyruvate dehydrogenase E2 component (dihydrolipoamide acetyltransferase)
MIKEVRVPEVAENVHEGKVTTVLVAVGDSVELDQSLMELETEKAVVALPAPFAGKVTEISVAEGDTVKIGDVIAKLETAEDATAAGTKPARAPVAKGMQEPRLKAKQAAAGAGDGTEGAELDIEGSAEMLPDTGVSSHREPPEQSKAEAEPSPRVARGEPGREPGRQGVRGEPSGAPQQRPEEASRQPPRGHPAGGQGPDQGPAAGERPNEAPPRRQRLPQHVPAAASPSIRRLARQLGVEIHRVHGSGPHGRISDEDVRRFVRERMTTEAATPQVTGWGVTEPGELPDFSRWGETTREPLSQVRQITAETMARAWATIPQVTQHDTADITELEEFRRDHNANLQEGEPKITVTAILLKVCAGALLAFPRFNASLDVAQRELVLKRYVHIAVAVDTDRGLLVPVVRDADQKGLERLASEVADLAARARNKRISPDEMQGGTFTISNLGGIGGTSFNPIVYPPQVAILGASEAAWRPIHRQGKLVPRLILPLSLTYDHRVVDGADGARFLRWITEALANPWQLMVGPGADHGR